MPAIIFILSICLSYLIGAIPMGFIMAKIFGGVDIRKHGSSNVGATNVLRVVGKLPAAITLIFDILKGVFAVTILTGFSYRYLGRLDYDFYRALLGLSVICGHIWPIYLKFKGGKGVATYIGVFLAVAPIALSISLIIWLAVFLLTNYVSLASVISLIVFPIAASIFNYPPFTILLGVAICLISVYKHKENIKRLIKGGENKTIIFKK